MTLFALALLIAAGVVHAGWNCIAKKAASGTVFAWMLAAVSCGA